MNSANLTAEQVAKLLDKIRPMLDYLRRLQMRMVEQGFPATDPLKLIVDKAYDGVHHLTVELHYLSTTGTGKPPRSR